MRSFEMCSFEMHLEVHILLSFPCSQLVWAPAVREAWQLVDVATNGTMTGKHVSGFNHLRQVEKSHTVSYIYCMASSHGHFAIQSDYRTYNYVILISSRPRATKVWVVRPTYQCVNYYTPSGKRYIEWMNEKPPKYMCIPNVLVFLHNLLVFLSQPERTYWSLTPQLETVIIEVSTVQVLRSRAKPWLLHVAIHLPSMNWTYNDIGFYSD